MTNDAEQALHDLVAERVAAVHAKDPETLAARLAPDVISFDALPPLMSRGKDSVIEQTQSWFDLYPDGIGYDVHELNVTAEGDVGFCSFVYRVTGTRSDGVEVDMWVRATLGCRRIDGTWLITHEHESDPFDPESGKALIDLRP